MKHRIAQRVDQVPPSGIRKFFDLISTLEGGISLGVGEPDFSTPWHIAEAAVRSLEQGYTMYTSNSGMPELRRELAAYLQTAYGLGYDVSTELLITNGVSEGLDLVMRAILDPGDEVIIPPYTFVATYNVVVLNYALPVFVDSDLESFQIDADKIDAAVTKNTRVIMPVHLGGYPADLDKILEVASKHQVTVVEDACQAHLAEWRGRKVGTWGMAGCFSFQASKNLNSGEGGAV
ncbi:MAG: aminotransferase class I/II-fold pyridoxal phosphate-dependent enzyme, partial [Chloroflexi bacterium]|nr:aminotransferase class I/II-fold pyridoxal phosphate-dependent enzyme [Chloroflexota bacterium]